MNIQMWEEVEWLKHAFPARVNAAVHLLFQRKLTHREVTDEPMELLLMYPETTQFHGSLLQCPPPPIPVSFLRWKRICKFCKLYL